MKSGNLNLSNLPAQLGGLGRKIGAYRVFIFFLVVASLYGYIVWRINVLSNAPAVTSEQAGQAAVQKARIDEKTIEKLQNLQDNSVSVQTLFDAARQDPFQE